MHTLTIDVSRCIWGVKSAKTSIYFLCSVLHYVLCALHYVSYIMSLCISYVLQRDTTF